jgi:hypothetical protein
MHSSIDNESQSLDVQTTSKPRTVDQIQKVVVLSTRPSLDQYVCILLNAIIRYQVRRCNPMPLARVPLVDTPAPLEDFDLIISTNVSNLCIHRSLMAYLN